ncbi:MAG: peptidylprolyl isomerase [Flavobacteriales bacterium]|nr:peptidylprolyl isomerase [Flavobacteriales bacterium]
MAVIGKIRERSGLLLVLVGGAMVAFILTDLFSNRGSNINDQAVGAINGEEIPLVQFEKRVSDELDSYRNDFGQTVDGQMTEQVRTSVWQEVVREHTLLRSAEEAGFGATLSKEEYDDIRFGNNVLAEFKGNPNFQGPDGQPSKDALRNYFESVQTNAPVYHEIQKRRMITNRLITKYNTLVRKSVFVNAAQVKDDHMQRNAKASFNFVAKRFDSEPDSLYTVTDQELRRYYEAHKDDKRYAQKPSRAFDYVTFPVTATAADIEQLRTEMASLKPDLEAAANDSLFITANSEDRSYTVTPYSPGTADALNDSLIQAAAVGTVVGPFREGQNFKLVKVKELAKVEEARVRHILLSTQSGKPEDEVKQRADSVLSAVKRNKGVFEDLVKKYSEDPGSVPNGGVYEWFDRTRMVPEFTKASFDEKVGAITIAKTTFGYHIVEVLGQRDRDERRVVSLARRIKPLPATYKEVYKTANEFSLNHATVDSMKAVAEQRGLQFMNVDELRADQRFVPGLQEPFSLISWVNRAEVGKASEPIEVGESYVVALLRKVRAQGRPELDDVREAFTREAVKEKKAEAWTAKMAGKTDLNALAGELGSTVQNAADLAFSATSIPGGFAETEAIGRIFAIPAGETSGPIKGDNAVYVVNMTALTPAPELADVNAERTSLLQRMQGRAEGNLFSALREAANVVDERSKFY